MRKFLFLVSAAAVMFASCQKNLDNSASVRSADAPEVRLKFNVKSAATKAFVESTASVLQTNGFKVAAVKEDNSVLFNTVVTYNASDGSFSDPDQHWYFPSDSKMAFYAVYPGSQGIDVSSDGKATLQYNQNGDTDLVGAKAVEVESTPDPVLMSFEHLLSQVNVKVQGTNLNFTYKLKQIAITGAEDGTYDFADSTWTPGEETQSYDLFNGETNVDARQLQPVGSIQSFIPGEVKLRAVWDAYRIGGDEFLPEFGNDVTVKVNLEKGKRTTLNVFLPANPTEEETMDEIFFTIEVGEWVDADNNVIMNVYQPELLDGVFTVNAGDKKVKFAKGNLYWNGSKFRCEKNQYDYPTEWNEKHVAHFFWSKDARVACTADYYAANETPAIDDKFFAADGGAIEGYTVLDKDEWEYLMTNALAKNSAGRNTITIAGKNCIVLKPDTWSTVTVADSYTAEDWAEAESDYGFVALPYAGYRCEKELTDVSECGCIWNASPGVDIETGGIVIYDDVSSGVVTEDWRYYGCSVRLVQVQIP